MNAKFTQEQIAKNLEEYKYATQTATFFRGFGILLTSISIIWSFVWIFILRYLEGGAYYNWYNKLTIPGILIGLIFIIIGKSLKAFALEQKILNKEEPYVLYLRPFKTDETIWWRFLLGLLNPMILLSTFATFEEQLTESVKNIGQLVALSDPEKSQSKIGAKRIQAHNDEWKNIIRDLFTSANLVIIRPGLGASMEWEIKTAIENVNPRKIIFLIYGYSRKKRYLAINLMNAYLRNPIPSFRMPRNFIIAFNDDYNPVLSTLKGPSLKVGIYKPWKARINYALQGVYSNLNVKWRPSPPSIFKLVVLIILILISLAMILLNLAS